MAAAVALKTKKVQFRVALNDVASRLSDVDLKSIRFICKAVDGLTKRDLELEDAHEFFDKLEERGVLSYDDTEFLRELLDMVHRKDCLELLGQYENGWMSTSNSRIRDPVQETTCNGRHHVSMYSNGHQSEDMPDCRVIRQESPNPIHKPRGMIQQVTESNYGEDLSGVFDIVVEEIGRDWRQLARKLQLTETDIDCIAENYMRNLREQGMQCLLLWKKMMRNRATKGALIEALKKCRMLYIADRVAGCQFR